MEKSKVYDLFARVTRVHFYSKDYYAIDLDAPEIAGSIQPGQFAMVHLPEGSEAILRRPLAFARIIEKDGRPAGFSLLIKIIGKGTRLLGGVRPDMHLKILGPLGNSFSLPQETAPPDQRALVIGGGIGAASLFFLLQRLAAGGRRSIFIYGGRSKADLSALDWVDNRSVDLMACTEDGSEGFRGMVTGPLEELLKNRKEQIGPIYACGPDIMMKEVTKRTLAFGRDPEVSLEARMGCGLGACLSCVVPARRRDSGRRLKRICVEGPIFRGAEIYSDGN
jgi:dihydroorotate dehydrogenase electron transfer subunit